jgi:hypothetical protein
MSADLPDRIKSPASPGFFCLFEAQKSAHFYEFPASTALSADFFLKVIYQVASRLCNAIRHSAFPIYSAIKKQYLCKPLFSRLAAHGDWK